MRAVALTVVIVLQAGLPVTQSVGQVDAAAVISRAAASSNLRAEGGDPFILQAQVRFLNLVDGVESLGSYELAWASTRVWRAQIEFPGTFHDVQIVNESRGWRESTMNQASLRMLQLRQLLDFAARLSRRSEDTVKEFRDGDHNGDLMRCAEVEDRRGLDHELCFDPAGSLRRETYESIANEYTDFAPWGNGTLPLTLRAYEGGDLDELAVEVRIETLEKMPPDPSWFELPEGGQWHYIGRDAEATPPRLVESVLPEYTPKATRAGVEGDVHIGAVVTTEGTVTGPRLILGLADWELNARALDALLQWRFEPGVKDGRPVPVYALFTVTYRIH